MGLSSWNPINPSSTTGVETISPWRLGSPQSTSISIYLKWMPRTQSFRTTETKSLFPIPTLMLTALSSGSTSSSRMKFGSFGTFSGLLPFTNSCLWITSGRYRTVYANLDSRPQFLNTLWSSAIWHLPSLACTKVRRWTVSLDRINMPYASK